VTRPAPVPVDIVPCELCYGSGAVPDVDGYPVPCPCCDGPAFLVRVLDPPEPPEDPDLPF
jgi:hypothetical protein